MYRYYRYALNSVGCLSSEDDQMIVNSEMERTYKEATVTCLKVVSQNFAGDNEGSFEKPQGKSLVSGLRIYSNTRQEC